MDVVPKTFVRIIEEGKQSLFIFGGKWQPPENV